ncbi:MAG: hypothetical protein BWY54_00340 [Candidatus Dependentiae bacterium ADurb.Bin331]|nr:MAG: hypothetical protein BWY54_00340 [Candidatus Dependentiae bacterium ADurb.Bin331]
MLKDYGKLACVMNHSFTIRSFLPHYLSRFFNWRRQCRIFTVFFAY